MGLYISLFEWFNPLYLKDKANKGQTQYYVDQILTPQLYDIVNSYQPELIWADGEWDFNDTYWKSKEFLAWLFTSSPVNETVVVNDRWGAGDECKHGSYWTCQDQFNPGYLMPHKWENALEIDRGSWSFDRSASISSYLTIEDIIYQLSSTVACGGNLLLNVGPNGDGTIDPVYQERLLQIGSWLKVNGDAIYETVPWKYQNETSTPVWYTSKGDSVYAILLVWPADGEVVLARPTPQKSETTVQMLGYTQILKWTYDGNQMTVQMPIIAVSSLPCQWAWVLQLDGLV
eukprot:TRINITY_DN3680_c0_g1_i2.p1 TRINITY_DN3680_c0_g1~~TRINITY_DN3680_c0_g1_i2.p1  ORF type:complete len:288 (-),score=38.10 TRINITY_DN3680_c0_g1_i2:52-915(-)